MEYKLFFYYEKILFPKLLVDIPYQDFGRQSFALNFFQSLKKCTTLKLGRKDGRVRWVNSVENKARQKRKTRLYEYRYTLAKLEGWLPGNVDKCCEGSFHTGWSTSWTWMLATGMTSRQQFCCCFYFL